MFARSSHSACGPFGLIRAGLALILLVGIPAGILAEWTGPDFVCPGLEPVLEVVHLDTGEATPTPPAFHDPHGSPWSGPPDQKANAGPCAGVALASAPPATPLPNPEGNPAGVMDQLNASRHDGQGLFRPPRG